MQVHQIFITNARNNIRQAWDATNRLKAMQVQWNAGDYGNTLADGIDSNEGITKAQVGAAVFDGADALMAVLQGGNGGNLANLLN